MSKSLLQKAKEIKTQKKEVNIIEGMEELALAWCRDEIKLVQISKVLGLDNAGYRTYEKIALALKKYLINNYKMTPGELKQNSHKNYRK